MSGHIIHPHITASSLTQHMIRAESDFTQKPGHAANIHNEVTQTLRWDAKQHVTFTETSSVISEKSAPASWDATVSGKCRWSLTCRWSTGLSHSSCSSLKSMSEDSWSRNTHSYNAWFFDSYNTCLEVRSFIFSSLIKHAYKMIIKKCNQLGNSLRQWKHPWVYRFVIVPTLKLLFFLWNRQKIPVLIIWNNCLKI